MSGLRGTEPDKVDIGPDEAAVLCGDAFDIAPSIAQRSVDLVCTSPPYWGLRTYGHVFDDQVLERHRAAGGCLDEYPDYEKYREIGGVLGLEPTPEWYVAHLVSIFERFKPALKESGSLWVNLGDTYFARWSSIRESGRQGLSAGARVRRRTPAGGYRHDKQMLLVPARFAIAMQERGWILRNDLIWSKPNVPPRPETDRLRLSHEHFFHFVLRQKDRRPTYYYDMAGAEDGALDVTTVQTASGPGGHSARFPPQLIDPRIKSSSPPGGLVLDPFCGSGTTISRSVRLGRRALGIELSPEYASIASSEVDTALRQRGCDVRLGMEESLSV